MNGIAVLVLGCGDVGSAVAHRLFGHGARVLVCDLPAPAHSRRGMAFTDAFFDGKAALEGVGACYASTPQAVHDAWAGGEAIPVTALPEQALLELVRFDVLVDAVMRRDRAPTDRRALARRVIGLGPGYEPGVNCSVAVETQWGAALGHVLRDRAAAPLSGGPKVLGGRGRERFVVASTAGLWRTDAMLGQAVGTGETVGRLAGTTLKAPIPGVLRGLTRDGVQVQAGQRLVEVDSSDVPHVFGLGERPLAIALGVCRALDLE